MSHDLIAIATLSFTSRAIVETDDITHENTLSVAVSGFTVSRLATSDIILNSVLDTVYARIDVTWLPCLSVVMRCDEVHSIVGSGPVPYTLLARLTIGL